MYFRLFPEQQESHLNVYSFHVKESWYLERCGPYYSYYSEVDINAGSIRGAGSTKLNLFLLRGLLEGGFY